MDNSIFIIDNEGKEVEMQILLTFEANDVNYVVVYERNKEDDLYAFSYDEQGNLQAVDSDEELAMIDEVVSAFEGEDEA